MFSPSTSVSFTNKCNPMTEILLKVELSNIKLSSQVHRLTSRYRWQVIIQNLININIKYTIFSGFSRELKCLYFQ